MVYLLGELSLPLDETVHLVVVHGLHELEGNLVVLGQNVHDGLNPLLDHFQHGFFRVHLRLLLQITHGVARGPHHFSLVLLLHPRNNLEEGTLTGPVQADDANLSPVEEAQVDVLKDDFVVVGQYLGHPVHGEDYFFVGHSSMCNFPKITLFFGIIGKNLVTTKLLCHSVL